MSVTLTCRKHPKYMATREPRSTTKHPNGCPGCHIIWTAVAGGSIFWTGKPIAQMVFIQRFVR